MNTEAESFEGLRRTQGCSVIDDFKETIENILLIVCETSATQESLDKDTVIDDVRITLDYILSKVSENSESEEIMQKNSVTDDVNVTTENILSIICNKAAAENTNADYDSPKVEDQTRKVEADETVIMDSTCRQEVIISKPINRPFLFDPELATSITVFTPPGPRPLIPWNDFDDVTVDDDVLTGKSLQDGQSWDCEDMFEYNEIHFGYKPSLDKDLSEYTTPLIREDTEVDRLRWERACRLADEIQQKGLEDQAKQVTKKKRKKKTKKVDADETVIVDSKCGQEMVISQPINRPFLYDPKLAASITVFTPPGPRPLIPWNDFDDVTVDDDILTGKDGQSWDCEDMFEYNEIHFGYKSSFDKNLSEYTTPLIREDTEEDRLRWERACRLADEIQHKGLEDQAKQVTEKKRKKKTKKANVASNSPT